MQNKSCAAELKIKSEEVLLSNIYLSAYFHTAICQVPMKLFHFMSMPQTYNTVALYEDLVKERKDVKDLNNLITVKFGRLL